MIKHNRQTAPTLDGIRHDHLERYQFASREIKKRGLSFAFDIGCGCGYGSYVMAMNKIQVSAFDSDPGAIEYGETHYKSNLIKRSANSFSAIPERKESALVMFEIIEHSKQAPNFLSRAAMFSDLLILSVPNQAVVPFGAKSHKEHYRHYTAEEMKQELGLAGWRVIFTGSQPGKHKQEAKIIKDNIKGRTLVFIAVPV